MKETKEDIMCETDVLMKTKDIAVVKSILLVKQKYKCLICKRDLRELPSKQVHLHHIHETGYVQGVLCANCNRYEGRVLNWFMRTGLKKTNIPIQTILKNLIVMYDKTPTNYIHPSYKTPEQKAKLKQIKSLRKRKKSSKNKSKGF